MADQTLTVRIIGDEKDLLRSLRNSTQATRKFSVSLGSLFKGAVVFAGVQRSFDALGSAVHAGIEEFSQAQKIGAQTAAAIKSTGGVAGVTARHVGQLALQLENLAGIDDEVVKAGENVLLSFTNIRNTVGKGNDIFDQAAKAALNFATRTGRDVPQAALILGKALADPAARLSSLARAGVVLTKAQIAQVGAIQKTKGVIAAQKIVLAELEKRFGGAAKAAGETLPGQLGKLREAFRNVFGDLVGIVAAPLANAAGAFAAFLPKIQQGVDQLSAAVGPAITKFVDAFVSKLPQLQRIAGAILDPLRERVLPILQDFARIAQNVFANVVNVFSNRSGDLRKILANLGEVLRNVWTVARPTIVFLFETVLPAALNIAIPLIAKITSVTRVLSQVFVKTVATIVKALDVFLGALTQVTDAASHLPFIGDKFKGISDKVNEGRESLRAFSKELDNIDGRKVTATVVIQSGGEGRASVTRGPADTAKKQADQAKRSLQQTEASASQVTTQATKTQSAAAKAAAALEKTRNAFAKLMDALSLGQERAQATKTLKDDIVAQVKINQAIGREIKIEGRTTELARQLFEGRQALSALRSQQAQGRQFQALGLTAEGEKRGPSIANLTKRLGSIRNAVKGTVLDTAKTRNELARIGKVLKGQFGKVGGDVKSAILQMLNDISSALQGGKDALKGPLTKTTSLNSNKVLSGLGLPPDQERALKSRLSNFNSAGVGLANANRTSTTGGFVGAPPVVVESHVTVNLDGKKVGSAVTRQQQKTDRRNPRQKRGPHRR